MQANRTYPKQTFPCDIRQRALNDFITSVKIFMKFGMEIMPQVITPNLYILI